MVTGIHVHVYPPKSYLAENIRLVLEGCGFESLASRNFLARLHFSAEELLLYPRRRRRRQRQRPCRRPRPRRRPQNVRANVKVLEF